MAATKKKLRIGRGRIDALNNQSGDGANNINEMLRIAEKFYAHYYDSNASLEEISQSTDFINVLDYSHK